MTVLPDCYQRKLCLKQDETDFAKDNEELLSSGHVIIKYSYTISGTSSCKG